MRTGREVEGSVPNEGGELGGGIRTDAGGRRQRGEDGPRGPDPLIARAFNALAFAVLARILRLVVLVHFRRARVFGREHFPRHGGALVVANHPSTWTDVVVMDVLLGRRLHFLALEELFRSWPGSMLLAVHGALPVYTSGDSDTRARRNAEMFRRCEMLLDRGEVVAIFPEGASRSDDTILPLKPGAARLALSYAARPEHAHAIRVVPVALRYSDRTAFQSDVVLNVGEPVAFGDLAGAAAETAVPRLTDRLADALGDLMPSVPGSEQRALVSVLEGITRDRPGAAGAERVRAMAHALATLETADPAAHVRLLRRAQAYDRARRALRLTDRALAGHTGGRLAPLRSTVLAVAIVAGLLPALVGALIHAVPAFFISRFAARYQSQPTRKSFARIGGGLVLFPPWYAILGLLAHYASGVSWQLVPGVWLACAVLGLLAIRARRWVKVAVERGRVAWLGGHAPRLLRRARAEWVTLSGAAAELEARDDGFRHAASADGAHALQVATTPTTRTGGST